MMKHGEEVLCGAFIPGKGTCESYKGHQEREHLGPGERCTYISPWDGTRCASRVGHGDPMHNVTKPRMYR